MNPAEAYLGAFREGLPALSLTYDQLTVCLGGVCYDVYLNDVVCWRRIAASVLLEPALDDPQPFEALTPRPPRVSSR
jgi:hypothetical protein